MTTSKIKSTTPKTQALRQNKGHNDRAKSKTTIPSQRKIRSSKLRLLLVWLVLVLGAFGLTVRLYQLQVFRSVNQKDLTNETERRQWTKITPYNPRRQIVDANHNIIATDELIYTLYAHPKQFGPNSKAKIATELATILGNQTKEQILHKLERGKSGIRIAQNIPESVADRIAKIKDQRTNLKLNGLDLEQQYSRFYPYSDMVAEVVGYLDRERLPQAGVELTQEQLLERPLSSFSVKRSFMNSEQVFQPENLPGRLLKSDNLQLQLTLDLRLQQVARAALKQKMTEYEAKRGAVIVMDVRDGSILAMVCEPTYNPNRYFDYNIDLFRNWSISDLYEPGSTFKPINVAIALDAGIISPDSVFFDSGTMKVDIWPISNHDFKKVGARGALNVAQILQYSSNVGMIKIMSRLNPNDYYNSLNKLGLTEKLSLDIPGSTPGHLKSKIEFTVKPIESATAAFGQGFSLTPIKLVQLHGAIANGGKLVTPHLVRGLADFQGYVHWQPSYPTKQVFSQNTTKSVLEMMQSVVEEGSGIGSEILGYSIAGKTGTAQKAGMEGGYAKDAKITSFVGIFPVESPRYAVLAVVDEPKGENAFGSTVAAPVVKAVISNIIEQEGIAPSEQLAREQKQKLELLRQRQKEEKERRKRLLCSGESCPSETQIREAQTSVQTPVQIPAETPVQMPKIGE
jgi:cell division protein FtsI (penicillin-binding protein 3)